MAKKGKGRVQGKKKKVAKKSGKKMQANGGLVVPGPAFNPSKGRQMAGMGGRKAGGLMSACCTLLNPFDPGCRGCRWPDGLSMRTMPVQVRGMVAITASTTGNAFVTFDALLPYGIMAYTVTGAYAPPAAMTTYNCPSVFTSNAKGYRVVCGGIRISCASAATDASGSLILSEGVQPGWVYPASRNVGVLDDYNVQVFSIASGFQYTYLFKPLGPRLFAPQSTSVSTGLTSNSAPTFATFNIEMVNAKATVTSVTCEYVFNLEFETTTASGIAHLAPPETKPAPVATRVIDAALKSLPIAHQGDDTSFTMKVESAVSKAASSLGVRAADWALEGAMAALGL